ncbi:hypothetical protein MMC20_002929 [Loxospora ochrophaea]|nr:hypothetical protein [Loxospora ochrophaea]
MSKKRKLYYEPDDSDDQSLASKQLISLLAQHEQHYPIFDQICSYLHPADIFALQRSCKKLSNVYNVLLRTQWNVDRGLRRFVKDPRRLRSLLGEHDALLSGSVALQFFERTTWPECEMKVFVEKGAKTEAFHTYLREEGYSLITTREDGVGLRKDPLVVLVNLSTHSNDRRTHIVTASLKIETYVRLNKSQSMQSEIQIWSATSPALTTILASQVTTTLANLIAWNKAYSLFPLSTFVHRRTHLLGSSDHDVKVGNVLSECSQRGWLTQPDSWEERKVSHPIQSTRQVKDRYTWAIPLDVDGVNPSETPDFVLESGLFEIEAISINYDSGCTHHDCILVDWFESEVLRHKYCCPPVPYYRDSCEGFFRSGGGFVWTRTLALLGMELGKIKFEERPNFMDQDFFRDPKRLESVPASANWEKPSTWTYYDDEIPKWYEEYVQEQFERKLRHDELTRKLKDKESEKRRCLKC